MSGELERYRPYGVARQHRQELDAVERRRELAQERIAADGQLVRQALREAVLTSLAVEEAARVSPSGLPEYQMIAAVGTRVLVGEIF